MGRESHGQRVDPPRQAQATQLNRDQTTGSDLEKLLDRDRPSRSRGSATQGTGLLQSNPYALSRSGLAQQQNYQPSDRHITSQMGSRLVGRDGNRSPSLSSAPDHVSQIGTRRMNRNGFDPRNFLSPSPPPPPLSTLLTDRDRTMASKQTQYDNMSQAEQKIQEEWAQEQLRLRACPGNFPYERIPNGYICSSTMHIITDKILAEGVGLVYERVCSVNPNHSCKCPRNDYNPMLCNFHYIHCYAGPFDSYGLKEHRRKLDRYYFQARLQERRAR